MVIFLDQLSTSQTTPVEKRSTGVDRKTIRETQAAIEEAEIDQKTTCENNAPYIFFVDATHRARIVQGCCNSWTCARCGVIRAKDEYGRMVNGADVLHSEGHKLYFVTITCRGATLGKSDAQALYGKWTNTLLTTMRVTAKRSGQFWATASVTERQKREHPHSHMICTFLPNDAKPYQKGEYLPNGSVAKHDGLYSEWFVRACETAGLGRMADYSEIRSPVAVAVYLGKYLFKDAMRAVWPKGWKRIRYSNSWPKLPVTTPDIAFPLLSFSDWLKMDALNMTVYADSEETYEQSLRRRILCVVPPKSKHMIDSTYIMH